MTEQSSPPDPYYYEDVIDLRELIRTLWKYKWIIVVSVLLAAVAAYVTDNFILPPQYEASAHVGIRRPTFQADLEPSIENPSSLEDYQQIRSLTDSLPQLAESEDVVLEVCENLEIPCVGENNERPGLEASLIGTSQLKLTVTSGDPERAAEFANLWAAEMVRRWNMLYGSGNIDLDRIEQDLQAAEEQWDAAQQALEAYLPESRVNVLEVQLTQAKDRLNRYLEEVEANQRIIRDARSLDNRLSGLSDSRNLPVGEALSLIALQQRASGSISGTQFQLEGSQIMGGDYRVKDAQDNLSRLIKALESQNQELSVALPELEEEIASLAVSLENEQYRIDQLQQDRDRARKQYQVMAGYYDEARINMDNQGPAAFSMARALVPFNESGQSTKVIVLIVGLISGMLVMGGVMIYDWWNTENEEE